MADSHWRPTGPPWRSTKTRTEIKAVLLTSSAAAWRTIFFCISGRRQSHEIAGVRQDLQDLRVTLSPSQISVKTRSLILWTERGAARHAKMLETDSAWDVFEALEDSYFRHRESAPAKASSDDVKLSTVQDREPLLLAAVRMVVKHRLKFDVVYQTMNYFAGSHKFAVMTKAQVAEAEYFVERFLLGNDTRQDWLRIGANRRDLTGDDRQPELLGFSVPGPLRNR